MGSVSICCDNNLMLLKQQADIEMNSDPVL